MTSDGIVRTCVANSSYTHAESGYCDEFQVPRFSYDSRLAVARSIFIHLSYASPVIATWSFALVTNYRDLENRSQAVFRITSIQLRTVSRADSPNKLFVMTNYQSSQRNSGSRRRQWSGECGAHHSPSS